MLESATRNVFGVPQVVKSKSKTVPHNLKEPIRIGVGKRGDSALAFANSLLQDRNSISNLVESVNVSEDMIYSDFLGIVGMESIMDLTVVTSCFMQL